MFGFKTTLVCALAGVLTACSGVVSPVSYHRAAIYYDRPAFVEKVKRDVPEIQGQILAQGRCDLYTATPDTNIGDHKPCVYAMSADALYIEDWDAFDEKYKSNMTLTFKDMDQVSLSSAGFGRLKQLQFLKGNRLVGVEFVPDTGEGRDLPMASKALDIAKQGGAKEGVSRMGVIMSKAILANTYVIQYRTK